jgi:N-methylhydantoinase A
MAARLAAQENSAPKPSWRIGVDIGGTFTDMVLADAHGRIWVFKEPSVPSNPAQGVLAVVDAAARALGLSRAALMEGCALFVHGSTIATNTMLEGKGAKVGLLVTEGFRDSLEIRRGIRFHQWDHRAAYPPVLVPRYLRLPVGGRMDSAGCELAPLDRNALGRALEVFAEEGVESVAIAFLNAYVNAAHEQAAADMVRQHWRGEWLSVSTDIVPIIGEYERSSTTTVNAAIAPRVVSYLKELNDSLRAIGLKHPLLLVQSNGGVVSVDQVTSRPVNLVLSGPAAGVGAMNFFAQAAGNNLISMEIGGTSCDVILMSEGQVAVTDELLINQYHVSVPSIDVHTVGAGGGTIAGVDAAGMLYVGPHGAGSRPGPACYGFGGTDPTVTDAQLVLGRLGAGPIGSGAVVLDEGRAREAVETKVARPLGIPLETAAAGIIRLLEQKLLHAVERISIERGYDPRRFTLVAGGGAGALHGASVGRIIGCRTVYVPRLAGAFCALGMLHSNLRQDYVQVVYPAVLDDKSHERCEPQFAELERKAQFALQQEGFGRDEIQIRRQLDLRYRGQQWSLRVALGEDGGADATAVRTDFESEYRRQFGHIQPDGAVEITALRVAGIGPLPPLKPTVRTNGVALPEPIDVRPVYLDDRQGRVPTKVYDGRALVPGHKLEGPLIVKEATTTVLVGAADRLEVDGTDNFVIHLG